MVTDILIAVFGGGATGLFSSMFHRVFKYFENKQQQKFILEKYRLDAELRAKEAEREAEIAETTYQHQSLIASYNHDTGTGMASKWVINILRLIRPTITLLLWGLVAMIWLSTDNQSTDFKAQVISTVMYCATAATLWWFGSRESKRK